MTQVRSPHSEAPTIYLYEAVPGGIGLSERLWKRHDELVVGARALIEACSCDAGLPGLYRPAPRSGGQRQGAGAAAPLRPSIRTAVIPADRTTAADASGRSDVRFRHDRSSGSSDGSPTFGPGLATRPAAAVRRAFAAASSIGAERLAAAVDGELVRTSLGLVRPGRGAEHAPAGGSRRGWRRCRASRRRTLPSSASTPRRPGSRPPRERWRSSSGSAGGRAAASGRSSSCCRITPTSRPCSPSWRPGSRSTAGWSRTTAAASTGRSSSPGTGWQVRIRRSTRATSTCCRSFAGSSATGMPDARLASVESELLGLRRGADVAGWEIPGRYLDYLRWGEPGPLVDVVRHNDEDVRSLARLLVHVDRGYADGERWREAPPGDLAGLARAFDGEGRHEEALGCLDAALAAESRPVADARGIDDGDRPARARATRGPRVAQRRRPVVVAAPGAGLRRPAGPLPDRRQLGRGGVEPAGRAVDRVADARRAGAPPPPPRPVRGRGGRVARAHREPRHGGRAGLDRGREAARAPARRPARRARGGGRRAPAGRASGLARAAVAPARGCARRPAGAARGASRAPPHLGEIRHAEEARRLDRQRCRGGGERRRVVEPVEQAPAGPSCRAWPPGRRRRRRSGRRSHRMGSPGRAVRARPRHRRRSGGACRRASPSVTASVAPGPSSSSRSAGRRPGREVLPADADQRGGLERARLGRGGAPGDLPPRNEVAQQPLPAEAEDRAAAASAHASSTSSATGAIRSSVDPRRPVPRQRRQRNPV